jgi:hypothetical protein
LTSTLPVTCRLAFSAVASSASLVVAAQVFGGLPKIIARFLNAHSIFPVGHLVDVDERAIIAVREPLEPSFSGKLLDYCALVRVLTEFTQLTGRRLQTSAQ